MTNKLIASLVAAATIAAPAMAQVKTQGLGLSSFGNWVPSTSANNVNTYHCPELKTIQIIRRWKEIQPNPGPCNFSAVMENQITKAVEQNAYVKLMIYAGPDAPQWVFAECDTIITDHPEISSYPDYTHPKYRTRFFEMIDQFGTYVRNLPSAQRDRILFVIAVEGATADGWAYKGSITNPTVVDNLPALTKKPDGEPSDWWNTFRQDTWARYKDAMPAGIPILVNSDSNTDQMNQWLIENMPVVAIKTGMFSHGYYPNEAIQRLSKFRAFEKEVYKKGKELITEGELDAEVYRLTTPISGWGRFNLPEAVYWSALYAIHNPVSSWNVISEVIKDPNYATLYAPTLRMFNKYAAAQRPEKSGAGMIALVDGLNATDLNRFPTGTFGSLYTSNGTARNGQRFTNIATAFASRGALLQDLAAAKNAPLPSRKPENGYNDVGWDIIPTNYSRFITQINPLSGDVGWWNVDTKKNAPQVSKYGRFARGFDNASKKNAMYFDVNDDLGSELCGYPTELEITVTYFDENPGSKWQLQYDNGSGPVTVEVVCSGDKKWKTKQVKGPAVLQNSLLNGADVILFNSDDKDDIFHMVEVEITGCAPWQHSDIGAVGAVGNASETDLGWTIEGSGADIWGTADAFHYAYHNSSGDCTVIAKVESLTNTNAWAKAGLMIRENTTVGARNAFVCVTPTKGVSFQVRAAIGGTTSAPTAPAPGTVPKWLKITRSGNSFSGYYSDNGFDWTQVGTTQTMAMSANATLGLAVTSHNVGTLTTSQMTSVRVSP